MAEIFAVVKLEEKELFEYSLDHWQKKVDLDYGERWELLRICNALIANERGHFNRAKALMKRDNLDYRYFYRAGLPFIKDPEHCRTFGKL